MQLTRAVDLILTTLRTCVRFVALAFLFFSGKQIYLVRLSDGKTKEGGREFCPPFFKQPSSKILISGAVDSERKSIIFFRDKFCSLSF